MQNILVTGGAGFIGSNLVSELLKNNQNRVYVFDNLSTGRLENLELDNPLLFFFNIDLLSNYEDWPVISNLNYLYHLSANADVRGGVQDREIDFKQNVIVTKSVCDYAKTHNCKHLVFASSATVYGEPDIFPTPESSFLRQTSIYGASKLAGEAFVQAYSEYSDFKSSIFRFVSWIGVGYSHGVIYDFYKKLKNNSYHLEILGDGQQRKSFLDVSDGIKGILKLKDHNNKSEIFNLGHTEIMDINQLAKIVCEYLELNDIEFKYTGSKRGWIGDSPLVHLDISKAKSYGWNPSVSIKQGIINTLDYLTSNKKNLFR
jgi:UDP-glucose 4-epimerase